jgi:ATP-dependent 26S proteasome regulatory subunit
MYINIHINTGEGARMVRELFALARSKKACIIFFDEVDAIGGARSGGGDEGKQQWHHSIMCTVN